MKSEKLIDNFSEDSLIKFFQSASDQFRFVRENEAFLLKEEEQKNFDNVNSLGEIEFNDIEKVVICAAKLNIKLSEQTSKKQQYEVARRIIKAKNADGGIFAFYDDEGRFRLSFIRVFYDGKRRFFTAFKRYSFFVDQKLTNKTFKQQIDKANFSSLNAIQKTFSIEAVTDAFYKEFKPKFDKLSNSAIGIERGKSEDFALLFVIRIIFLGFVQKKGWLGDNEEFLQLYLKEYMAQKLNNAFYNDWLDPLFFEALNSPPGRKVKYQNNTYSKETEDVLQMSPFLNGELFKPHKGLDRIGAYIPDADIAEFMEFLFQYNFTIEENTNIDEELELSPEFLGIIFERLVNKKDGAIYTPRTEVDFMCRLSLVKWLEKNTNCRKRDLFELFFREGGIEEEHDDHQREGDFTPAEIRELVDKLQSVTICDPAAGSGAFEVGMMQVLNEIIGNLQARHNAPDDIKKISSFDRKKRIIARSLYGVEVKHWAVWINQLRLWLSLFIDMPDDYKNSFEPLLPSLNFKVRVGDSLVQRIGNKIFPIHGHATLSPALKGEITKLRKLKSDFYHNVGGISVGDILHKEIQVFKNILAAEITEKQQKLQQYGSFQPKQKSFDLGIMEEPKQATLDIGKEEKQALEAEIASLEDEFTAIRKLENRPFIWSIEFAEIFYDKGGFDIIIGNPPYVRQESIADPNGYVEKPKDYKDLLKQVVETDYPDYFVKTKTTDKKKITGNSDLYTYFYAHTLKLLNPQGIHCFICSNSWLDVGFGVWMQELLLNHVQMRYIIDNHAKRSFASADVNTVITIFDAPQKKVTWQDEPARFVAFKKPFEEAVITENLLKIEEAKETIVGATFRAYVISHKKLQEEGTEDQKYIGEKWGGKYLRAPDIFFTILEKGKDKLVKLKDVAAIKRGITTGCNEFFYLTKEQAEEWKIEEEFLKPVIKSPRECKSIQIDPDALKFKIFMCNKSKAELHGTNALKYIEWGEELEKKIKQGQNEGKIIKGIHNLESIKGRKIWYSLGEILGTCFWVKETNKVLAVYYSKNPISADCRLYYGHLEHSYRLQLNATVNHFIDEVLARAGLGLGARSKMVYEVNEQEVLLFDDLTFKNLNFTREVQDIFTECGIDPTSKTPIEQQEPNPLPDRKALDDVIFDALNLTKEERKDVYRAVCRLVWNRISKAKNK